MTHTPTQPRPTDIEAVVFDFDGTLADTRGAITATMRATFAALGSELPDDDDVTRLIGLPLREIFIRLGCPTAQADVAAQHYRAGFDAHAGRVTLYPGAAPMLEALVATPLPLAIASSRGRHSLGALVSQLGIEAHFTAVLGDEDATAKKPAPDLVLALSRRLGVPPARMLVVGDTTYDIEMGRRAGAATCAVTHGSHDADALRGAGPGLVVDSLVDLQAFFAR